MIWKIENLFKKLYSENSVTIAIKYFQFVQISASTNQ